MLSETPLRPRPLTEPWVGGSTRFVDSHSAPLPSLHRPHVPAKGRRLGCLSWGKRRPASPMSARLRWFGQRAVAGGDAHPAEAQGPQGISNSPACSLCHQELRPQWGGSAGLRLQDGWQVMALTDLSLRNKRLNWISIQLKGDYRNLSKDTISLCDVNGLSLGLNFLITKSQLIIKLPFSPKDCSIPKPAINWRIGYPMWQR